LKYEDLERFLLLIEIELKKSITEETPKYKQDEIIKSKYKIIENSILKFNKIELIVSEIEKIEHFHPRYYFDGDKSGFGYSKRIRGERLGGDWRIPYNPSNLYSFEEITLKNIFKITFKKPIVLIPNSSNGTSQDVLDINFFKFVKKKPIGINRGDKVILMLNIIQYENYRDGFYKTLNFMEKNDILPPKSTMNKFENIDFRAKLDEKDSNCFVVTTTMGDTNHPVVNDFRNYRDDVLLNTILGRLFIKIYYQIGPYLSEIIKNDKTLFQISRSLILKLHKRIIKR
jgi:hypothetical protein